MGVAPYVIINPVKAIPEDNTLRRIPPVNSLMETVQAGALLAEYARPVVLDTVRAQLAELRQGMRDGAGVFHTDAFFDDVRERLRERDLRRLQRVLNATGIVIHTNLGRAPLAEAAVEAVRAGSVGLLQPGDGPAHRQARRAGRADGTPACAA